MLVQYDLSSANKNKLKYQCVLHCNSCCCHTEHPRELKWWQFYFATFLGYFLKHPSRNIFGDKHCWLDSCHYKSAACTAQMRASCGDSLEAVHILCQPIISSKISPKWGSRPPPSPHPIVSQ